MSIELKPKADPLRFVRQFTARKPYLLGEGVVGGIAVFAGIASFADWGIQVARFWLAIFGGLLVLLIVIAKIAGDQIRDAKEEADRQLVADIHKAVVQVPGISQTLIPGAQIGNVHMFREDATRIKQQPEPDVSLRFMMPNHFELHNYGGDATDVSMATVTIDEYIPYPLEMPNSRVPAQTVIFPKVDVDAGATTRVIPVFIYLVTVETTMAKFIEAFIERRHVTRSVALLPEDATPLEIRQHQQHVWRLRDEPVEIEMRLSYEGRATGRMWERVETLHYDPATSIAHVNHGVPVEITIAQRGVTPDAPDVTLDGPSKGKFILRATGHACEIRTGPIILESAPFGLLDDNEKKPVRTPRYALEFSVYDLRDGDKEITPTLFCGEGYSRSSWPEEESERDGVAEFLRMAVMIRSGPASEKREVDWDQPLHVSFDITFWNREHTHQWKRRELLVYEPQTRDAFVRHAGRPEPLLHPGIGARL